MKNLVLLALGSALFGIGCATAPAQPKNLEKYPQCYHQNPKISDKCVKMNEAGEATTAAKLENAAYPGEYK